MTRALVVSEDVPVAAERAFEVLAASPTQRVAAAGGNYRCAECGYGVTVRRDLLRCPTCGIAAWVEVAASIPRTDYEVAEGAGGRMPSAGRDESSVPASYQ